MSDTFKGIDYILCVRGNKTLLNLDGSEVEGRSLKWLQELIGDKVGEGVHQIQIKKLNDSKIINKRVRAILPAHRLLNPKNEIDPDTYTMQKERRARASKDPGETKDLIKQLRELYDEKVKFYKERAELAEERLAFWKKKAEARNDDEPSGGNMFEQILTTFIGAKMKTAPAHGGLHDSAGQYENQTVYYPQADAQNIPVPIAEVIKTIDFDKVSPEELARDLVKVLDYYNIPRRTQ